jgi:hypothetical protein
MSEPSDFRTIECVGGPLDGFWEEDVAERFYVPIEPRFSPNDGPAHPTIEGSAPTHPGYYNREQDGDRRVYRWYPDGN